MRPDFATFDAIAKKKNNTVIAVAAAHDKDVLDAVCQTSDAYGISAILFGDTSKMRQLSPAIDGKSGIVLIDAIDDEMAVDLAVAACRSGTATILMKGHVQTASLMRAVLNRNTGLRKNMLLSHVMFYAPAQYGKLLALTDGGLNTFPDLEQKKVILSNALGLMRRLGYEEINVSIVAAAEKVDEKIKATLDGAALARLPDWQEYKAKVIGPVGLDLAISKEAVTAKHYQGSGAGEADLLLVPTYEVGNAIGKTLTWFAGAPSAGLIVGASVPIIVVSRSDDSAAKQRSIALAMAADENNVREEKA